MSSTSSFTILPVELIELVMDEFWTQPLSSRDRAVFMKSSLGVSKTWAALYVRIFCQDVHIPTGGFALKFLSILRQESPLYNYYTRGGILLSQKCRSISFQSDNDKIVEAPIAPPLSYSSGGRLDLASESPMGIAIYAILRAIYFSPFFAPNLRRISIHFSNAVMRDLFSRNKFIGFPTQVTELEIDFTYDPRTPTEVLDAIADNEDAIGLVPGSMKNVRKLHAVGLTQAALDELLMACPRWEELEVESWRCGRQEQDRVEDAKSEETETEGTDQERDGGASEESDGEIDIVTTLRAFDPRILAPSPSLKPVFMPHVRRKERFFFFLSFSFVLLACSRVFTTL